MKEFRTAYDENHVRYFTSPGNRLHDVFTGSINGNGEVVLVKTGEEDIYDMIQSHRDSVDIHVLMARYKAGETDVLEKRQLKYGDFTEMPKTFADVLNITIQAKEHFASLPVETRAKFGHSFEKWLVSMDKADFAEKMGFNTPSTQQNKDSVESVVEEEKGSAVVES